MESAIRWSPSSNATEQRFLSVDVTGKAFRLCKVTGYNAFDKTLRHELLSTLVDVPSFRAFDWSASNENLIAVGQSSGEATILRLDASVKESLSFPVRNQRSCNAVAFSAHGLVASGLDRVRNDFCLNIWDVNQRLSPAGGSKGFPEPLRKLASSEPITSIKFFKDQPDTLVTGVKGQFLRIYDLREGPGNPSLQFQTRCVHNLAIDWLDENYIASCQPIESTVCVWDRRVGARLVSPSVGSTASSPDSNQSIAALQFKNVFESKSSIWSLRFSKTTRGYLGALSSTGHFKAFEIAKDYQSEEYRASIDETFGQGSFKNYPEPVYTRNVRDVCLPFDHPTRGCEEKDRVVTFDFINLNMSPQPSAIALDGHGQPRIITARPPCAPVSLSSRGMLAFGIASGDSDFRTIHPLSEHISPISGLVENIRARVLSRSKYSSTDGDKKSDESRGVNTDPISSREMRERAMSLGTLGVLLTAKEALTLSTLAQSRCREGYLFNEARNRSIVKDDPALQDLWTWIQRARSDSLGTTMVVNGLDMNYVGVCNVWTNDMGHDFEQRRISTKDDDSKSVAGAIAHLVEQLNLPPTKGCETAYPEHRRLCLRICGATSSYKELAETVKKLSSENQHTKAAALAVFQDEAKLAYLSLRSNEPAQAHKLLAMAIAGAAKGDSNSDWEETCAEISKELTDPYARAILALVSKGDWHAVLQETTLPLKYRVEVALRWLPDDELTEYLGEVTSEAIREGDIEGVVLTGLGHLAMGLFRSYIEKFNDVQTPVLAMSYTVPRIISHPPFIAQFNAWRETYRQQMNSWKMQLDRARFDVESRRFAVTVDGRKLIPPPPQQVSLTCNYCTRPLTQHDASSQISPSATVETVHPTVGNPLGSATMSGTVCPRCGRHMPRCGVCTMWLGTPDPMSKGVTAADAETDSRKAAEDEVMKRFVVFCINCNHGHHAHHARDWFARHKICPVAECNCICDR
ncbi:ubiquitin-protein ligase E3 [Penicillium brasilianum]|uniref:Ubiquitin-protein ligase E3 n=1 Tax=Penicillium brasilianum TaxID=104259 RepID=A0A1S9RNY4_PENBI|nr:ubiquitin-protein ligase E3 [Penicillium brasilianum]